MIPIYSTTVLYDILVVVLMCAARHTIMILLHFFPVGQTIMGDGSINNLFPAIGRIFAVIILGYILGKFKLITHQSASAVGVIVGKIALPALLLQNMAILDLSAINWRFMAGILIARSLIFGLVFVITLVFTRPVSVGKPAILAIFCTQSNDFALGLPICKSFVFVTYGRTRVPR